jgi:hypothetical protein
VFFSKPLNIREGIPLICGEGLLADSTYLISSTIGAFFDSHFTAASFPSTIIPADSNHLRNVTLSTWMDFA